MEKKENIGKSYLLQITEDYSQLKIVIPANLLPEESKAQTHIIFALDNSGSMAGSAINTAKIGLLELTKIAENNKIPLTVASYNTAVEKITCTDENYEPVKDFIENIKAYGGTQFKCIFDKLLRLIKENPNQNYFIAFFTDGCDNDPYNVLEPYLLKFKEFLLNNFVTVAIHTVGFTESHDVTLLNKIIKFGTKDGTFQFVQDSAQILSSIGNLEKMIDFINFWGELQISEKCAYKLNFQKDFDGLNYVANLYVDAKEITGTFPLNYKIKIHQGKEISLIPIEIIRIEKSINLYEMVEIFLELARNRVINLTSRMMEEKIIPENLAIQKAEVDKLRNKMSELMVQSMKSHDSKKMLAVEKLKECKEIFTEYFSAFTEAMTKGIVSKVSLAKLNNVAYKGVIDSRVARELAKRAESGQKFMENMISQVEEIKKKLEIKKLEEKYKDSIEEFGHCAITYQTWLEALEDGDCLCLTYDAERDLSDIFDSSTVRIKTINVSMLTSEAFVNAANFVLDSKNGVKLAEFGHSDKNMSLAKVLPNEIVNGILPLYICEEHWQIAKLKMRPMNAWTDTHDILAIAKHQPIRIPFLVMIKALDNANNEFSKKQFKWILDTCMALYKQEEHKELIFEDYKEVFIKYIESPHLRTTEFVKNIPIFFSHFCFALIQNDIKIDNLDFYIKCIFEEILRRETTDITLQKQDQLNFVSNAFNLSLENTAKPLAGLELRKRNSDTKSDPVILILKKLEQKGIKVDYKEAGLLVPYGEGSGEISKINEEESKIKSLCEMPAKIPELAKNVIDIIAKYREILKNNSDVNSIVNMAKEFLKLDLSSYRTLEGLGITTNEQLTFFVLQNSLQASNAKRKVSANAGNYLSPYAEKDFIIKALTKIKIDNLNDAVDYFISKEIKGKADIEKTKEDAQNFKNEANMYKAASIIMGLNTKEEWHKFVTQIIDDNIPVIKEKLIMILNGTFKGVQLYEYSKSIATYRDSDIKRLISKHFINFTKSEWYNIATSHKEILDEIFKSVKKSIMYGHPPLPK